MKKIFIIIFIFIVIIFNGTSAKADFLPVFSNSINHYGIGVMRLNNVVEIYEEKDENSQVVQKIYWDNLKNYNSLKKAPDFQTFVAFYPKNDFAFLSVEDEDNDWYFVCYNQKEGLSGWIKQGKNAKFYTWAQFITQFGKKRGLYVFRDLKDEDKILRAKPQEDAPVVDSWKYAKFIQPWYISGNWLMVKIWDYDNSQKTGYLRWRSDEGKLFLFVNLR